MRTDIAIVGAGMAGASLAAMIGDRAGVVLIEAEDQPGYHSTGRSAAFWSESYGGPVVQPLTTASGPWLEAGGFLNARGCLHIAGDGPGREALDVLAAELEEGGVAHVRLGQSDIAAAIPGLAPGIVAGLSEPSCRDIDVAALHADVLGRARRAGAILLPDARVQAIARVDKGWRLVTRAGGIAARVVVNAAGAWADMVAEMAGVAPLGIQPYRRTVVQLAVNPPPPANLPLVLDALGRFYFKPEAGGKLWVSPHDETAAMAHDVAAEELDVALAIDRLQQVVDWRVIRRERAWAGLRSFAPDRLPVYGFDASIPGFFWFAGQGGFGIQTAPAAAMLGAALLLGEASPADVSAIDIERYAPTRFGTPNRS